ncbi:hypothetical protein Bca52824_011707 [Brassica carinata]|uniref:Prolamin-like domain-containing protein n=1 Tax=Brassica carinata TaxID=52824 RepID=A0A8X7VV59_BRACI|nr:hypothetical protein Bca52824_011707 [Brassica carinata]
MEMKPLFIVFLIIVTFESYVHPSFGQKDVNEPLVNPGREMEALKAISPASQDYNIDMLENLPPKYVEYLNTCADKMGSSGTRQCNEDCCLKVVRAGKECYMEFRKFMFRLYQLKRFASQVSFKISEVWNRCSAEVESRSSSHA